MSARFKKQSTESPYGCTKIPVGDKEQMQMRTVLVLQIVELIRPRNVMASPKRAEDGGGARTQVLCDPV